VLKTQEMLVGRGKGRDVVEVGSSFVLRECQEIYGANFSFENWPIASDNAYLWNAFP
jgi:hypothetical protein